MIRYKLICALCCLVVIWQCSTVALAQQTTQWRVQFKGSVSSERETTIRDWVSDVVTATEKVLNHSAHSHARVLVESVYFSSSDVPWGEVKRGTPITVLVQVNRFSDMQDIEKDWTLYHEIAHIYLPYLPTRSRWLSEGFATFMQNVIMLESSVYDRAMFEQRLLAGLKRGAANTQKQPGKLAYVSADMWQRRAYQRVYWSGTAFFIEAQLALQKSGQSLAEVVSRFNQCCYRKNMSAKELVSQFDKISNSSIFSGLYARYRLREDFPAITRTQIKSLLSPAK